LVYTGPYIGQPATSIDVVTEVLDFRRRFLAITGMMVDDHVMLRGPREEMIDKLMQIQFAPDPSAVVDWMINHHIGSLIESYGLTVQGLRAEARSGVMALTKWTADLRHRMRQHPGHDQFFAHLRRAAFTTMGNEGTDNHDTRKPFGILIVPSGLDPAKALGDQTDEFWWAPKKLGRLNHPYAPFEKIIRGISPGEKGIRDTGPVLSIDTGPGGKSAGPLTAVRIDTAGQIVRELAV
jgi:serine/threonine protein phosphatase 1